MPLGSWLKVAKDRAGCRENGGCPRRTVLLFDSGVVAVALFRGLALRKAALRLAANRS